MKAFCSMTGMSRSSYYRWRRRLTSHRDMKLRDEIQRIALQFPCYGYRPVTAELRRRNWLVNHKRVLHWMRADNLLALRRKSFAKTTDSGHPLRVYPNLAKGISPTGANQLWVSDLTYVRLRKEFIYLAVILDA